jgi:ribokinase
LQRLITVVGSANVDLIMRIDRIPRVGETVSGGVFTQAFGGKGANQALAAARAGAEVSFIACLGEDSFGAEIVAALGREGIDLKYTHCTAEAATGIALITVDRAGHNAIAVAPGANHLLLPEHVDRAEDRLQRAALILLQGELHPDTLDHVLARADALGRPVLLNLAPAQPLRSDQLRRVQWLVVNETEAEFLTDIAVDHLPAAHAAADQLRQLVGAGVILTLGERGALVHHRDQRYVVPAFPVEVVDTTAAGDAFCGALAVGLVEGMLVDEAVRSAAAAASVACTRLGAQTSLPKRMEIEEVLREKRMSG